MLYVLPLGTFVVSQAPDQIVQRLLEPIRVKLGFSPFRRCFTCWLRSEGLWNSADVAGHDAGEHCCRDARNDVFIGAAARRLTSRIPTPVDVETPEISYGVSIISLPRLYLCMQIAEGMWTRGTETPPAWHRVLDSRAGGLVDHRIEKYLLEFHEYPRNIISETLSDPPPPTVQQ